MDCSRPGLPVHHQLPELAQAHVHQIGDVIQPSHPLSSPSPPALNLSQHQGLFLSQLLASGSQGIGSFSFNAQAEAEIQTLDGAKFSLQVASLVPTAISPTDLGLHLR